MVPQDLGKKKLHMRLGVDPTSQAALFWFEGVEEDGTFEAHLCRFMPPTAKDQYVWSHCSGQLFSLYPTFEKMLLITFLENTKNPGELLDHRDVLYNGTVLDAGEHAEFTYYLGGTRRAIDYWTTKPKDPPREPNWKDWRDEPNWKDHPAAEPNWKDWTDEPIWKHWTGTPTIGAEIQWKAWYLAGWTAGEPPGLPAPYA